MERKTNNVKHFIIFGRKCYIKREDEEWESLILELNKGILVGYSSSRKAYKCFNIRLNKLVERINVTIDETGGHKIKEERKDSLE
jgi:hypothetical protein